MASETDQKTLVLIQEVAKKKTEIAQIERPQWKTNCSFSYDDIDQTHPINIHVEKNIEELVSMVAFLQLRSKAYKEAAKTLEIHTSQFTWLNFKLEDWISDIKTRINKIQINLKKEYLQILEGRLNKIISPELRAELELQAIAEELKAEDLQP